MLPPEIIPRNFIWNAYVALYIFVSVFVRVTRDEQASEFVCRRVAIVCCFVSKGVFFFGEGGGRVRGATSS